MAILIKGTDYTTNDQVTAQSLDELVDNAVFATGAVDDTTIEINGSGQLALKAGGIPASSLSVGGPTWTTGGVVTVGDLIFNNPNPEILGNDPDGILYISPGATKDLGGNIVLYGDLQATKAGDIEFRDNTTLAWSFDNSASAWSANANSISTTGTISAGSVVAQSVTKFQAVKNAPSSWPTLDSTTVAAIFNADAAGTSAGISVISGNTGLARINFGDYDAEGRGGIVYDNSDDSLDIWTAGATKFSITSAGVATFQSLVGASGATITGILDEDAMGSDSATHGATQQSIKAYVDTQIGGSTALATVLGIGNTTGGTDIIVSAADSITVDTILETTSAAGVTIDSVLLKDAAITTAGDITTSANLYGDLYHSTLDTGYARIRYGVVGGTYYDIDFRADNGYLEWRLDSGTWESSLNAYINTQTGTAYTLVIGDTSAVVEMNNASANTLTIPPNSSVAFLVGTRIDITQYGAGTTTIAPGVGVTLRGLLDTALQYAGVSIYKRATDEWVVIGGV